MDELRIETAVDTAASKRLRLWVLFLILAVIFHFLIFNIHVDWHPDIAPPPVEVQKISPQQLDRIREQWKEKSKNLLIDKDPNAPSEKEPPKDARYESDRNIRVDREQKARISDVVPKPGRVSPIQGQQAEKKAAPRVAAPKPPLKLGNLGVRFKLNSKPQNQLHPPEKGTAQNNLGEGQNQTILEDLPEGSENLLNAQESVYYSFFARINESIGPVWKSLLHEHLGRMKLQGRDYQTVVLVTIDDEGHLVSAKTVQSSGNPTIDRTCEKAFEFISRFPNPPQGLLKGQKQFQLGYGFTLRVSEGFQFDYSEPSRVF